MSYYDECFSEYWRERYRHYDVCSLVRDEAVLSAIIDSDLSNDCPLIDEILLLYEIVRDECVNRVSYISNTLKHSSL